MRLSNFVMLPPRSGMAFAEVDATSGMWFWKETERKVIFKSESYSFWKFKENGQYCQQFQAENLEDKWRADNATP